MRPNCTADVEQSAAARQEAVPVWQRRKLSRMESFCRKFKAVFDFQLRAIRPATCAKADFGKIVNSV